MFIYEQHFQLNKCLKRIANCLASIDVDDLTTAEKKIVFVLIEAGYLKEVGEIGQPNQIQYKTT